MELQSNLANLPFELVSDICDLLEDSDNYSLLFTCKKLQQVARRRFRAVLNLSQGNQVAKLVKAIEDVGVDKLGLDRTVILSFATTALRCKPGEHASRENLLRVLKEQVNYTSMPKLKKIHLRFDELDMRWKHQYSTEQDSDLELFLLNLKSHSDSLPKNSRSVQVSASISGDFLHSKNSSTRPCSSIYRLIDITNLTILDYAARVARVEFPGGDNLRMATIQLNTLAEVTSLTDVLTRASRLRELKMRQTIHDFMREDIPFTILNTDLRSALEKFQKAMLNLKNLEVLEIGNPIFYTSYFIAPPESTKRLSYNVPCDEWWREYLQCSLPLGLECLTLTSLVGVQFSNSYLNSEHVRGSNLRAVQFYEHFLQSVPGGYTEHLVRTAKGLEVIWAPERSYDSTFMRSMGWESDHHGPWQCWRKPKM
ncbi:hypothetical protein TWF694_007631 [Orbilia ellipsospora]|uniref:F-box domain-containing protein n=1 Tax=Orbilia ellipsospora TaxID=2528407 RepID=A0AAV9XID8_9PEZI